MSNPDSGVVVAALYRFARFPDFQDFREPLLALMLKHEVRGTMLLANEGVNGTIAGSRQGIDNVLEWLQKDKRFANLDVKESSVDENPFYRTKVKLKKEIVTMGVSDIDPRAINGTYIDPEDWNRLLDDPEVLVLDTRNQYEVEIGSFEGAVNPETTSFREFPDYVRANLDPSRNPRIAMFCTGGIRCEKSTAYLKQQGFEEVYHLRGGILNYLESVPLDESRWRGECFVFDNRVTVDHDLQRGNYDQCHACRMPITETDKASEHYRQGVSCPHCVERTSPDRAERFAERERQVRLASARGEAHIGQPVQDTIVRRKREKHSFKARQREIERSKKS